MALRAARMSNADTSYVSEPSHLLRKLLLLFLLIIAASLGAVLLFREKPDFPVLLFGFFMDVALGLIAGLGVRNFLRDHGWFVRGLTMVALVLVGLGILGYFTDFALGIGPFELPRSLSWPMRMPRANFDLLDFTQLVIAIDTAWITTRAWRQSSVARSSSSRPSVPARRRRPVAAGSSSGRRVQLPRSWSVWPKPRVRSNGSRPSGGRGAPVLTFQKPAPMARRRSGLFGRRPAVSLAVTEEHKCPYCLAVVRRSDPRGVRECEVCHTLHHADCWAITGVCQVPHLNT